MQTRADVKRMTGVNDRFLDIMEVLSTEMIDYGVPLEDIEFVGITIGYFMKVADDKRRKKEGERSIR